MSDKRRMTRSEVHALYEKEVASIRALRNGGEHQQGIGMAMNEARRWLDRELDRALPDPVVPASIPNISVEHGSHATTPGMRLGDRLRMTNDRIRREQETAQARAQAEADRLEQARRMEIKTWLLNFIRQTEEDIIAGMVPKSVRMPRYFADTTNKAWGTKISSSAHRDHDLWNNIVMAWASREGLTVSVYDAHDGMGMESWFEIRVVSA